MQTIPVSHVVYSSVTVRQNILAIIPVYNLGRGERGGSVVECRTPEREVGGSKPTVAVLCP